MLRKFAAAASLSLLVAAPAMAGDSVEELKAEAMPLVKEYATTLVGALKAALEKDGPTGAISVCHDQAPKIAADLSKRSGWQISRTSLKVRNPNSAPDGYETATMLEFQGKIASGADPANLAKAEVVSDGAQKTFRLIKAIPTQEVCLTCHGTDLKPDIADKLRTLYPADMATGFKAGDMRGVFTLRKPL